MLKRLRANHPLVYCLGAVALFLAAMFVGSLLLTLLLLGLAPWAAGPFLAEDFLFQAAVEAIGLAVPLALLWRSGRLGVFARRGAGFLDGLLVGVYPFVWLSLSLSVNLALVGPPEGAAVKAPWRIAAFFLAMFLIGLAEEALFRGVVAETLLAHFGPRRAGVWKACAVSGALFGLGHAVNLMSSEPMGVLIQCCVTAALGMLYAAIYYRTGNLWVLIFLHTLQDVAALINSGLYDGTATISEVVSSYDPSMLLSALLYLLPVFYLLRGSRLPLVAAFWGMDDAPEAA